MRRSFHATLLVLGSVLASIHASPATARELTIEDRVAAQRAIEAVRWRHRSWPVENPGPKPALSTVMPEAVLRARVEDYLRKSNALEDLWRRPITAEQLQAEMNRMAASSRDPMTLRELFSALGNDPFLIAETLARPVLADRLVRGRYAYDTRFHDETKARARQGASACAGIGCMKSMGGDYNETTWVRRTVGSGPRDLDPSVLELDDAEWDAEVDRLARRLGVAPEELPIGRRTGLEETPEAFVISAVLSREEGRLTVATASWPKRSFDDWWATERASRSILVAPLPDAFERVEPTDAECGEDPWSPTSVTGVPDDPRHNHTAIWTGTEMIVWGGQNGTYIERGGGRYNPATDTWMPVSGSAAPTWRTLHAAVWTGSEMIVWGGNDNNGADVNTGGRYNPVTDSWVATSTGTGVPTVRRGATAVWSGSEMIVWGGNSGSSTYRNTGGRYNPATDSWIATSTTSAPSARWLHSATWTGTEMIVWGGSNAAYLASGGRYNPVGNTWTATPTSNAPAARREHTAIWTGSEMIVWGGAANADLDTGGRYSPSTNTWTATSSASAPVPRRNHTAVWTGTEMIVWGGGDAASDFATGGRYAPASDSWSRTSTGPNVPEARSDHTAVWTGTEMLVWGGYDRAVAATVPRGARYDPATDTWTAPAASVTPAGRTQSPPVWTGTEMIVWGGSTETGPTNSGGRYEPATDTWTPTSRGAGVPGQRNGQSAIWTGSEMIVWGGANGSANFLQSGGRYDPVQDSWTPTSGGPNLPDVRGFHTAVWTGTEMIVWGGSQHGALLNTGGRYDPATDTWLPTSTGANVPIARNFHGAVWAGPAGMLVWGGQILGGYPPTPGGIYDPATNTWKEMTMTNAPSPRAENTVVGTGAEMIVWGGFDAVTLAVTNTGGRYDPASDTWSPTSTGIDVPQARFLHAAIWTGSSMIVWGGGGYLNTGGIYDPVADTWSPTPIGGNVPAARVTPAAVWTGSRMIVWGGSAGAILNTGGVLCMCASPQTVFVDADCDGWGGPSQVEICGYVTGCYSSQGGDCNDGDSSMHPQGTEICNGLDDDCDGSFDEDVPVPTEPPLLLEEKSGSDAQISWPAVSGANLYDVVKGGLEALRGSAGDYSSSTSACAGNDVAATNVTDTEVPAPGDGLWYLVRPVSSCSGAGSYDEGQPSQLGSRDAGIAASGVACP